MKDIAIEVLNIIYDYGYEGYIVGGFVRDMLLGIKSRDVDITTNATPMELKNIFPNIEVINSVYGAVTLYYKKCRFEITTYRMDLDYLDNRHPNSIIYVNSLKTDLLRRDFTINTICMDKNGQIVDLLNGQIDLGNKLIRTVGNSVDTFKDDALRMLRAIRFATILDFKLSDEIVDAINKNKELLKNLSYERKKMELDKIFTSSRAKEGIELLKKFQLADILELTHLDRVFDYSDLIGIWSMINTSKYPFKKSERDLMEKVNIAYELDNLDNLVLYKYGLYINLLAGINKSIDKKTILKKYKQLPIKERSDILISVQDICCLLKKEPGSFISEIYDDLEKKILNGLLKNDKDELKRYISNNY